MHGRTVAAVGVATIGCLALVGVYGLVFGVLVEPSGELLVPVVGTLAVTALVVVGLAALGARSKRWRKNPYW
ncbi:hypothetical protein [Natrarchaeobius oligotrophus]|uniref:Uncharacterized protein n=1 Tax=Natrarchaeobius chitinivorans TaxID=1679083 RepID=A0A3N6MR33_NATCH|nr:hypothetical protein [Natrarchaeobius chitinivorans]RQG98711.1 hypothetical protein EA472_16845 [Natrarchaeobius chitinivorans]